MWPKPSHVLGSAAHVEYIIPEAILGKIIFHPT